MLIFIRISALNLSGQQTKSCNFTKISKAQKLKNSRCPSINKIVYYFARLGFGIAEYNDRSIIEKEKIRVGWVGGCGGLSRKMDANPWKMKSIVQDLSEKIMACMTGNECWMFYH